MKGIYLRIDDKLNRDLTQLCRKEGFKKSGLINKLIQQFLAQWKKGGDPLVEAQEFGIDISLLKENLNKSPTERLRNHEEMHKALSKIRGVGA